MSVSNYPCYGPFDHGGYSKIDTCYPTDKYKEKSGRGVRVTE